VGRSGRSGRSGRFLGSGRVGAGFPRPEWGEGEEGEEWEVFRQWACRGGVSPPRVGRGGGNNQ